MPLIPRLNSLWRNLFHKDRVDQEFTEEIQAYLDMLTETKIREGLTPREARRNALVELGGVEQVLSPRISIAGYYSGIRTQDTWVTESDGRNIGFGFPGASNASR